MVREGTIAQTPEQLDAWLAGAPEVKESLQRGGYDTAFTSADLFPLLQVFVVQASGPPLESPEPPAAEPRPGWMKVLAVVLVFGVIAIAVTLVL
jgi:hypothetical protein